MTTEAYKRKRQELQKSTQDQHDHIRKKAAERVAADEAAAAKEAKVSTMGPFCVALFPLQNKGTKLIVREITLRHARMCCRTSVLYPDCRLDVKPSYLPTIWILSG
jgi:hypothetical protein